MRASINEIWHLIPYGHYGKTTMKKGSLSDWPWLWQRPGKCLHFVELVY